MFIDDASNHIYQQTPVYSKSLEDNFRFTKEDNILLMLVVAAIFKLTALKMTKQK